MIQNKRVLAIIPARGGSKGLPGKNIKLLLGKPLISYSIDDAKKSKYIDRIIVSTDDEKIAKVARKFGAEVPFMRPAEFSTDTATTEKVLQHAIKWLEDNEKYNADIIVYLENTIPLRDEGIIDKAIEKLVKGNYDTIISAMKDFSYLWERKDGKLIRLDPEYIPRQKRIPRYKEHPMVYISKKEVMLNGERIGKKVEIIETEYPFIDLHDEFDWWLAEEIIKKLKRK